MTAIPMSMPMTLPKGPASFKYSVPDITNEPQPILVPSASDQAPSGDRYERRPASFLFALVVSIDQVPPLAQCICIFMYRF